MECCGLHYQCDINEYEHECTVYVYVYADEDYENYIDSFTVVGNPNYCEETYLNRAYDSLFDMSNWYKEKIGYEVISNPSLPGIRV